VSVAEFTPTQRCMYDLLADGLPHTREELRRCLPDDMGSRSNIRSHIFRIRKILEPDGLDVLCVIGNRPISYRLVRLLVNTPV
jgi:hypothetical protein